VLGLHGHRGGAAQRLQVRDDAEDLRIGQADRRLVDRGHPGIESRHDEGVGLVHRLREVLDVAEARLTSFRANGDVGQIREAIRPFGLPDRVAREAEALPFHDLATHLRHLWRAQVCLEHDLRRRLHFLLRHHLADVHVKAGRGDHQRADTDQDGDGHAFVLGW
jgi:hypothetical protein